MDMRKVTYYDSSTKTPRPFIFTVDTGISNPLDKTYKFYFDTYATFENSWNFNIKTIEHDIQGITITNFGGSWGNEYMIEFSSPGIYDIEITGIYPHMYPDNWNIPGKIIEVKQWGDIKWESCSGMFRWCENLIISAIDIPIFDKCTTTYQMFENCTNLSGNFNNWDLRNVQNAAYMFGGCTNFNSSLNNWNTSNIQNMSRMFQYCIHFNQNISSWELDELTNASDMFNGCSAFNQPMFNSPEKLVIATRMFFGCSSFNNGGQSLNWNLPKAVIFDSTFRNCTVLNVPIILTNLDETLNMYGMFANSPAFNQDINFITPKLTETMIMFSWCTNFNSNVNISMGNVIRTKSMFDWCSNFNKPLTHLNVSKMDDAQGMFRGCVLFNQPLNNWNTEKLRDGWSMFSGCTSFKQDISSWNFESFQNGAWFLNGVTLPTAFYDALLVSLNNHPVLKPNVGINCGGSKYTAVGERAKNTVIGKWNWGFSDGGLEIL